MNQETCSHFSCVKGHKCKVIMAIVVAFLIFAGFSAIFHGDRGYKSDNAQPNTITVTGKGEALAKPDIATVSFSVFQESKAIADAQKIVTDKTNKAVDFLKNNGIAEKDIKTTGYNIYPQYDYLQAAACTSGFCPSGKQVLRGYQVTQSIDVKIRDISKAGTILSGLTDAGVNTVSGLTFSIDNQDAINAAARKDAIDDAQSKAKQLAKDLGVRLVRIVSFNENNGGYPVPMYANAKVLGMGAMDSASAPVVPTGENTITSNVTITYEIR